MHNKAITKIIKSKELPSQHYSISFYILHLYLQYLAFHLYVHGVLCVLIVLFIWNVSTWNTKTQFSFFLSNWTQ